MKIINTNITTGHSCPDNDSGMLKTAGLNLNSNWYIRLSEIAILSDEPDLEQTQERLVQLGYKIKVLPRFSYTWDANKKVSVIECPAEYNELSWVSHVKLMNHNLNGPVVARVLNHMAAWDYVIKNGMPTIITESPSLITVKHVAHVPRNSIVDYSGMPLMEINRNWHSMQGLKYYSVDQFSARALFNHIVQEGIRDPLEVTIRDDLFMIVHK